MHAELFFNSKVHKGSHFHFTLHLPPSKVPAKQHGIKTQTILHLAPGCHVKALVVDDVKENRDVLAKLLEEIGVETIEAENGQEAVRKTTAYQPDIVFMDMRMPVMRGEEALNIILKESKKSPIKIVAITASALDKTREHYLGIGFHEYLSKPYKEEDVFNCLNELLEIEFSYEKDIVSKKISYNQENLDLSQFTLPEELHNRIKNSAELASITQLEAIFVELDQNSEGLEQLIEQFRSLMNQYDTLAILGILDKVSVAKNNSF